MTAKLWRPNVDDPRRRGDVSRGTISIMYVVFAVVAAAVVFVVVALTLGRGDLLEEERPEPGGPALGPGMLRSDDVENIEFPVVVRGYRMDQVDAVMARLATEMAQRDARIAELETGVRPASPGVAQRPRPYWGDG